jgi:hypothetical protein
MRTLLELLNIQLIIIVGEGAGGEVGGGEVGGGGGGGVGGVVGWSRGGGGGGVGVGIVGAIRTVILKVQYILMNLESQTQFQTVKETLKSTNIKEAKSATRSEAKYTVR